MHAPPKSLGFVIYYYTIAIIGIPANLAVIGVMLGRRCGLSRCITVYLLAMAVTDLLVIFTGVILNRIVPINLPNNFLTIIPACIVNFAVVYAVRECSVWVTVMFTFDRHVAICCQRRKTKYCTERTAALVIGTVIVVSCLKNVCYSFIYEAPHKTGPTPCIIKSSYYTSPGWIAFDWIDIILTPCLAFLLILLLNLSTTRHIVSAIRIRRKLQGGGKSNVESDPETDSRWKSIVLLLSISGIFILLWLLVVITFLYIRFASVSYSAGSNFKNSTFALEESGYALQFLCSCVNPFIYAGTQSKIRDELKLALKYPLTLCNRLLS